MIRVNAQNLAIVERSVFSGTQFSHAVGRIVSKERVMGLNGDNVTMLSVVASHDVKRLSLSVAVLYRLYGYKVPLYMLYTASAWFVIIRINGVEFNRISADVLTLSAGYYSSSEELDFPCAIKRGDKVELDIFCEKGNFVVSTSTNTYAPVCSMKLHYDEPAL